MKHLNQIKMTMNLISKSMLIGALVIGVVGCSQGGGHSHGHGHGHSHGHGDEARPDKVTLSEAAVREHGLKVEIVTAREIQPRITVPARVAFNEETTAHVGSLVSGRVSTMKAHIGELVKEGDVLFEITSPELGKAQNAFLQAQQAETAAMVGITLAENNATTAKADAEVKAAATKLVLAEKSVVVKQAEADLKAAEAQLALAENSASVNKAQADLKAAGAAVALTGNNATITAAQGKLDAALPVLRRAREFYETGRKLADSGAIAITELKRRETAMLTAEANVQTARSDLAQAKAKLTRDQQAAIAAEKAAEATLEQVRAQQARDIAAAKAGIEAATAAKAAAITEMEQDIAAAKAEIEAANAALHAVQAAKVRELGLARSVLDAARASVATARNQLELLGMDATQVSALSKSGKPSPLYLVRAPRAGRVVDREVTLGENVSPAQPHLLILADLSQVWVLLEIAPQHVDAIREGQTVDLLKTEKGQAVVIHESESGNPLEFKLEYISPVVDDVSRTVQARIETANHGGVLKPGQFLTAKIHSGKSEKKLVLPTKAIQYHEGHPVVFVPVRDKPFTYRQRRVKIGGAVDGWVPIKGGLEAGEEVVVQGSFLLKAEFGKAGAGHDHSH